MIHQIDVKIAFLNVESEEEIYMNEPKVVVPKGYQNVCTLFKSLYNLKQTPK